VIWQNIEDLCMDHETEDVACSVPFRYFNKPAARQQKGEQKNLVFTSFMKEN
jgi:hypothetical protein